MSDCQSAQEPKTHAGVRAFELSSIENLSVESSSIEDLSVERLSTEDSNAEYQRC